MPPSRYSTKARRTNPTKTSTTIVGFLICLPSGSLLQCARLDEHHIGREVLRQASLWWPRSQKTQKRELSLSGPDLRQADVIFTGIEVRVHLLNYSSFLSSYPETDSLEKMS